jgi:DNA repair exonuclease SbcCD ATPase subunit
MTTDEITKLVEMAEAAFHDDRLSDGMLYRKLGQALTTLQSENERLTAKLSCGHNKAQNDDSYGGCVTCGWHAMERKRDIDDAAYEAIIAQLRARVKDLEADRDSWEQQTSDRAEDILRIASERDALQSQLRVLEARCEAAEWRIQQVRELCAPAALRLMVPTKQFLADSVLIWLDKNPPWSPDRATSNPATGEQSGGA